MVSPFSSLSQVSVTARRQDRLQLGGSR
jgi:hypothetical protein